MSVPKYYEMHKPILEFMADGRSRSFGELKETLIRKFSLTESDLAQMMPSGRQTYFVNRAGWARTYLKKAGLIDNVSRGVYVITPEGQRVVRENPPVIDNTYLSRYDSFREFVGSFSRESREEAAEPDTPDDELENAFARINQSLADDLLAEVLKLSPTAFERMVLDLMARMGYGTFENAASTTPVTGDEGIDGIIMEDKLGFDLIYVQAKRWDPDHLVGRPDVQAFVGVISGKGGRGLFVTTSRFSRQAIEYARGQHVVLMDGRKLTRYMIEHNFGVSVKKTFEIKGIDSDAFEAYQDL